MHILAIIKMNKYLAAKKATDIGYKMNTHSNVTTFVRALLSIVLVILQNEYGILVVTQN